jgi:hypothetical protein
VIAIEPTEGLQARAEIAARCSIVTRHQSEIESSIRRKIGAASSENLVLIHKTEISIRTVLTTSAFPIFEECLQWSIFQQLCLDTFRPSTDVRLAYLAAPWETQLQQASFPR